MAAIKLGFVVSFHSIFMCNIRRSPKFIRIILNPFITGASVQTSGDASQSHLEFGNVLVVFVPQINFFLSKDIKIFISKHYRLKFAAGSILIHYITVDNIFSLLQKNLLWPTIKLDTLLGFSFSLQSLLTEKCFIPN